MGKATSLVHLISVALLSAKETGVSGGDVETRGCSRKLFGLHELLNGSVYERGEKLCCGPGRTVCGGVEDIVLSSNPGPKPFHVF